MKKGGVKHDKSDIVGSIVKDAEKRNKGSREIELKVVK